MGQADGLFRDFLLSLRGLLIFFVGLAALIAIGYWFLKGLADAAPGQ